MGSDKAPTKPKGERNLPLIRELTQFYATVGLFATRWDIYDGLLVIREAENRARELVRVAEHHPRLLAFLKRAVKSNDYVTMLVGHGLMTYAILAHHGRIKASEDFLTQIGYSEEQVLTPPEVAFNGSQPVNS